MDRRQFLGAIGTAGVVATAGCGMVSGSEALSDPTVHTDSPSRQSLEWTANDESIGELGVSVTSSTGVVDVSTELSHSKETNVDSIKLRVWTESPETDTRADIALVSPVEGDSSSPPSISLYSPDQRQGTVIEITDLDDLRDETISTLNLLIRPQSESATTIKIDATIELTGSGVLSTDYTLTGELPAEIPTASQQ